MTIPAFGDPAIVSTCDPIAVIRARAVADVRCLRALARAAYRDGSPKADLRSANARAAARQVLDQARRLSALRPPASNGVRPAEMAD
ncbi:hypothetical protein GCM10007887_22560 [Methylobacterium haplocladii]|uniref:Uncharacterized protein n=1 Tax=Methylobacterium haplocladii TaxID=1176176 RepID=A0A512IS29_9HYPH|nr:hypothetical protein MHA02_28630 [Methylobacterium haplocladii]GJD82503.1 hypothetical protein HPGCJGGD_0360 [Methylobacterium haplocladii]GLS59587.1 hypothetical protein GCM10007887_22560 [Methylobacterium haplocladii]